MKSLVLAWFLEITITFVAYFSPFSMLALSHPNFVKVHKNERFCG